MGGQLSKCANINLIGVITCSIKYASVCSTLSMTSLIRASVTPEHETRTLHIENKSIASDHNFAVCFSRLFLLWSLQRMEMQQCCVVRLLNGMTSVF